MTNSIYKILIKCVKFFIITTVIVGIGSARVYAHEIGVQLLSDPGFEESIPNGTFPTSGAWAPSWLYEAGQICTTTAIRSGNVGLYIYTGSGGTSWRSDPYQAVDKTAEAGDVFTGEVWARSLSSWVSGSQMLVRLTFLNSFYSPIVSKDSTPLTTASSGWTKLTVVSDPAPPGTAYIRYRLYLAKPSGVIGQSIGNFDDCYLELTSQSPPVPQLNIYPQVLGLTKEQTQAQFTIKNIGDSSLNWYLTESESWITGISPASGTTAAGADTIVTVTIIRVGLSGDSYKGTINVTSDGGNETVTVYMDMANGYDVPPAPSLVTTDGYRVLIQKRLPNGLLDTIKPYVIKGVAWSPSSLGNNGGIDERRSDFQDWFIADIQLIKEMNANTVYTFLDFGTGAQAADILNNLYKNGIMAIVTVDEDGSNNTSKITEIVNAYKNHPAILMWAIGNEWNLNYYHDKFGDHLTPTTAKLQASADATELAAQQIKGLDTKHPIASIHGEIDIDNRQPLTPVPGYLSTQEIVNEVCPSVDVWGVNIYRGDNFGTLFLQWASIADKPLFLSEFGTDSYYTTGWYDPVVGYESETDQNIWLDSLWTDIEPEISAYDVDKVCLGGTVFEWSDEWWKIPAPEGSPFEHDNEGFDTPWNPFAHPDGFANEEYFGIVHINRKTKQVYPTLYTHFAGVSNFAPIAISFDVTAEQGVPLLITLKGTDVEVGVLTYEIVDNPVNGNLTPVSGSTVTYTSFAGYTGEDPFTFRCFDGAKYSSPASVSITVVPLTSITVLSPNGGENWTADSVQTITWTSEGTVEDVKIDYTTNNGETWTDIVSETVNDGTHPWTVPDAFSSQCFIRVSETDGSPSDISDSVFSIVPIPTITVTSPNGGENWMVGSAHNITWTSDGVEGNIKIEYSTNNGDSWTEIIASTENDGTHPWTVADAVSSQCLVRVSETDGSPADISDSVFIILPPSITVTSPNGEENWEVNSQQNLTWTSTGTVVNVKIEYSTNIGGNWTEIIASTENDGTHPWTVPDTVSNQCLIRVSETDGSPSDTSDAVFTIFPPSLTVTSPNGGENWNVDSSQAITWTSHGTVGNVMIEYSVNNGGSWNTIVQSTENDGSYNWNVPATPADNCLVRVSETDEDGGPSDISDAVFSIVSPVSGSITIRSPNGGESWLAGSTQQIKWNSTGDINYVNIKYSKDNGTTWKMIAKKAVNNHSYNWIVPETASDKCLVRVSADDGDLEPKPSDVSDAVFSIILPPSPTIRVTAPNGGEQLVVGSWFTVTWRAANTREDVRIEYSINGGQNWREITAATENNGKYEWTVPDEPSDNCLVRISETDGQPSDVSSTLFSIVSPSPADITVTSPNGGETWTAGSSQEIKWTATGIDHVTIEYSKDNGTTWKTIVQTTPNSGSFDWTVPEIASDECLVRITSNDVSNDPIPADISDGVFSIVPPASPTITVMAPNGGEQLTVGSSVNITWSAVNSRGDVKIEYSINGGQEWIIITDAADNNGDYEWLVPDTPSETCMVRISEIDGQPLDISDAVFSIVEPVPGEITIISPNGGESWTVGSLQEIKWTAEGINNVTIECSIDYGTTWQVIVQTTANDGSFDWTIPDIVSDECLVRVSSNDGDPDPVPSDISDEVFSMVPDSAGEFRVISPNGGESWEVGTTQPITWTNSGDINSVMIEYSYDNGNTWNTIVSSLSNSGTYDWQVADTVSEECLVRITANDGDVDPKPTDVSDSEFSIVLPSSPTIRVITPNGGEQLVIGSIYEITWFGTDSRAEVKIEYSINGGQTWTEIIGSTENDGDYDWLVPDEPSETCLVRISEIDGQPVDVSDAVFSIVQPQTGDLTVLTPNGGENLESGSEYNISWTCSGLNNVIIEYSINDGVTWLYIDKVPADNGGYAWTVLATPSDNCLVRATGADSDENPSDVSDGVFTIFDPSQASIEVFTPNGGESLGVGEEYYITWASTGINNVLIEYSTTNGEQWNPIDTVPALGGRFTWAVPNTPSESCLIRISGADSPEDPSDVSDAVFSITSN
ncbi:MAG: Ig-like domain-containing protein [Candidatus Aminicenantes bacterium]|jgi:hypothetical protein